MKSKRVTKHTRARRIGKVIACPHCGTFATVYHFAWVAMQCEGCGAMVPKLKYWEVFT
jgi:ribosomal protein S27E